MEDISEGIKQSKQELSIARSALRKLRGTTGCTPKKKKRKKNGRR